MRALRPRHQHRRRRVGRWTLLRAGVVAGILAAGVAVATPAWASVLPALPVSPVVPVVPGQPVVPVVPGQPVVPVVPVVPTKEGLCGDISAIDAVVVVRTDALPLNHFKFSFPATVAVPKPAAAQAVARALCALPAAPPTPVACPADFGIAYRLTFSDRSGAIALVLAEPSGCQIVEGGGLGARTATAAFWVALGRAMGLAHPGPSAFRGTGPG